MATTFGTYAGCTAALLPFVKNKSLNLKRIVSFINPCSIYASPIFFSNSTIEKLRFEYINSENKKEILKKIKHYRNLNLNDIVSSIQKMALLDYYKLTEAYLFDNFQKPEYFIADLTFILQPMLYFQKHNSFLSWNQGTISLINEEQRNGHQFGPYELIQYEDLSIHFFLNVINKLANSIKKNYNKEQVILIKPQCDFITFKQNPRTFFQSKNFEDYRRRQIFYDELFYSFQQKIEGQMIIDFPYLNFYEHYDYSGYKLHYPKIFQNYIKKNITDYTNTKLSYDKLISKVKSYQRKFAQKITKKYFHKLQFKKSFISDEETLDIINKFFISFLNQYQNGSIKKIINHRKNNGFQLIHPKIQLFRLNHIRRTIVNNQSESLFFIKNKSFQDDLRSLSQSDAKRYISMVYNFALMFDLDPQNVFLILWKLLY